MKSPDIVIPPPIVPALKRYALAYRDALDYGYDDYGDELQEAYEDLAAILWKWRAMPDHEAKGLGAPLPLTDTR
jgi:hypothetical protein